MEKQKSVHLPPQDILPFASSGNGEALFCGAGLLADGADETNTLVCPRVMIMDNDAAARESLAAGLTGLGYQCFGVAWGEALFDALSRNAVDALLMEVSAGEPHHPWVVERAFSLMLTARCQYANLPTLAVSGAQLPGLAERALHLGMIGFLSKPAVLAAVDALLRPAINQKRALDVAKRRRSVAGKRTCLLGGMGVGAMA